MKTISVIVPVYNVKDYLRRCLDSIVNQTYKNLQIILVDDGSTDGSEKICDEYAKKDQRIMVIHKKNEGQSIARKVGLECSNGELISFIDSDDFISLNFYYDMQKPFANKKIDMTYCKVYQFSQKVEDKILENNNTKTNYICKTKEECLKDLVSNNSIINNYMCNKLYKRELFNDIVFPHNNVFEDLAIMYKIIDKIKTACLVDKKLYFYFNREGSSSKKISSSNIIYKMRIIIERENYIKENYSNIVSNYEMYHIKNIIYCCSAISKNKDKKNYNILVNREKEYLRPSNFTNNPEKFRQVNDLIKKMKRQIRINGSQHSVSTFWGYRR